MIELVGWAIHQHYRTRKVPWVKQHTKSLNDPTYRCLSHGARSLLNDLWMLAGGTTDGWLRAFGGKPCSSPSLAWMLREDVAYVAAALAEIAAVRDENDNPRWLILHGDYGLGGGLGSVKDSSRQISAISCSEREGEGEGYTAEGETETALPPAILNDDEAVLRDNLRPEYYAALVGVLRAAPKPDALVRSVRAFGPGGIHECATWDLLGHALHDLEPAPGTATAVALKAFILRLKAGDPPPRATGAPRQTQREKNLAVLDKLAEQENAA